MEDDNLDFVKAGRSAVNISLSSPSGTSSISTISPTSIFHASLVFVTGLPANGENTDIPPVVDHFRKMAHFMTQPKLLSDKESAQLVLNWFCLISFLLGLAVEVVSDRGPQLSSVFWKELCNMLRATISLLSAFYPEFDGQT